MYPYPSQWSFVAFSFLSHNLLPPSEKSHVYVMMSSSRCKTICVRNFNIGIFSESVELIYFKTDIFLTVCDNHCCTYSPGMQHYCRPHYIILWATFLQCCDHTHTCTWSKSSRQTFQRRVQTTAFHWDIQNNKHLNTYPSNKLCYIIVWFLNACHHVINKIKI